MKNNPLHLETIQKPTGFDTRFKTLQYQNPTSFHTIATFSAKKLLKMTI